MDGIKLEGIADKAYALGRIEQRIDMVSAELRGLIAEQNRLIAEIATMQQAPKEEYDAADQ